MANSVETVEKYCFVSEAEKALLLSKERPIVLLERKSNPEIPEAIAPKMNSLGFMLPYAPLHFLLLEKLDKPLVMTSGNISDEPICYQDSDAGERLKNIADHYLLHDRRIHIRTDDSVVRVLKTEEIPPRINADQRGFKADKSNIRDPNPRSFCAVRAALRPRR